MPAEQSDAPNPQDATPAVAYFMALQRASWPRRWLTAAVIGAAIGLFARLALHWWWLAAVVALTAIAVLLTLDRYYGFLAGLWPDDLGQHRIAAAAAQLERHGWSVLHDPIVPNQQHVRPAFLYIGPGGLFVVEHQSWTVADTVTISPTSGLLLVRGQPAARRTAAVRAMAAAIDETLSDTLNTMDISVRPVIAVDGKTLDDRHDTVGVTLVPVADLTRFLRGSEISLSTTEITTLTGAARRLFTRG